MTFPEKQEPLLAQVENTTTKKNSKKPRFLFGPNFFRNYFFIFLVILSILTFANTLNCILFYLSISTMTPDLLVSIISIVLCIVFWVTFIKNVIKKNKTNTRKFIEYYERPMTYFFYPSYFSIVEKSQVADAQRVYSYAALENIEETSSTFILNINPTIFYIIPKNGFILGTQEELYNFFSTIPNLPIKNHTKYNTAK